MARPLRIEFPGAVYHVTARGDRCENIFVDDADRRLLLAVAAQALERFDAQALAYCLMGNHYHFVLHTAQGNLSRLMRHLNGVYTQDFNRRHDLVGHLFQGRFKAVLVDRDAYLMEVCRYVDLNPVRAGQVNAASDWRWSSYRAHTGLQPGPDWLDTPGLHAVILGRPAESAHDIRRAAARYADLVASAQDAPLWPQALRQQIYLGNEAFVARMQERAHPRARTQAEVPRAQRQPKKSWEAWLADCATREDAMWRAYRESGVSMTHIAEACGLSVSRVSRLIARLEGAKGKT